MNKFYPEIGIRPKINGHRGGIGEFLKEKTLRSCVKIAPKVAEFAMTAGKFKAGNVGAVIFETSCRCYEADLFQ